MKINIYGLAGMLFVLAVLLWVLAAWLWYIAVASLIGAGAAGVIGLFRMWAPGYVQVSRERHTQAMDWEALRLREQVLAIGARPGYSTEFAATGTVVVTAPQVPRGSRVVFEEIEESRQQPQLLLPSPNRDECLYLSEDFQPHADTILSQRGMVVGISGSGKSNTLATLHEELGRLVVPLILFDTENEYGSLCDRRYLPQGRRAGATGSLSVSASTAENFGRYIIENHLQIILDLTSYSADEAAYVMVNILAGLQAWEEEYANADRVSFMVTLSEAHVWLPQNSREVQCSADAYDALQSAFFTDLVRRGRKRGLGLTFDLQRIAEVDKRLMQSSWKILHRQTEENDLKRYEALGLSRTDVLSLGDGEAYVFSSQVSKHRVQIRRRNSPHEANTPGLASIKRRQNALRNFDERDAKFLGGRNDFDEPAKPFRVISGNLERRPESPKTGIPETTKQAILELYQAGRLRTQIRDDLNLNGDEYWMVKQVCNEYDQSARRA